MIVAQDYFFTLIKIIAILLIIIPVPFLVHYNREIPYINSSLKQKNVKKTMNTNILPPIPELEDIGLTVTPDNPREYVLTNRDRMHWTGETNKEETRKWQGLVKNRWTTLTNFWMDTNSEPSELTAINHVVETTVYPHAVKTTFSKNVGKFDETVFLVRNKNIMIVQYQAEFSTPVEFRPQFGMRRDWAASGNDYQVDFNSTGEFLYVSSGASNHIGIKVSTPVSFIRDEKLVSRTYSKDDYRGDGSTEETIFEPGRLVFSITPIEPVIIVVALGDTIEEIDDLLNGGISNYLTWWQETTQPLVDILLQAGIKSGNETWDKAIKWSLMSLDSLTMNISGRGIYAGLHWFPEYWGRDSFISFPGAVLSTGQFELAKEWIRTMIANQDTNPSSSTYGRVPNILQANVQHLNYETADGTGWFIKAIWSFFEYAGLEMVFLNEIWPAVNHAIQGEISRTDADGFLTHGDRETWMDAQTGGVIASPRGNRAVEIQALWFSELDIGSKLARLVNENELADQWNDRMVLLKDNFQEKFWDPIDEALFDHLNIDGSPDYQKRPNEIFAITVPLDDNPLLTPYQEEMVLESVLTNTMAPHGILSLSSADPDYHPQHDYGSRTGEEHHDFSYHNGDVWLWLSGPVIEAAIRLNKLEAAQQLTGVLLHRIVSRGALGTLGEIMDGTDNDPLGHSRGTISQAWSLAELIRNYYQNWLGIQPNAVNRTLRLVPRLSSDFTNVSSQFRQNEGNIVLNYTKDTADNLSIDLNLTRFTSPLTLEILLPADLVKGKPIMREATQDYLFEPWKVVGGQIWYYLRLEDFLVNNLTLDLWYNSTSPAFTVDQPLQNKTYQVGELVPFSLTVLSGEQQLSYEWESDIDDVIGTTSSFQRSDLTAGRHLVTVTVTGENGISMKQRWLIIGNANPLVRIEEPVNGSTMNAAEPVHLKAKIKDLNPEDKTNVYWKSNIDGLVFSGTNGTTILSLGEHVLEVIASDGLVNVTSIIFITVISQRINMDGNIDDWSPVVTSDNSLKLLNGEVIWQDELGDDTGDSDYQYPTYNLPWSVDIARVQITTDDSAVYFLVTFNRSSTTDWAQRMASIFIGLNTRSGGLQTITTIFATTHPLSITIHPSLAPEIVVLATAQGEMSVRDENSNQIVGTGIEVVASNGNLIEIKLSWNVFIGLVSPDGNSNIDVVLASFLYDDTGSGFGAGGARQVTTLRSQWTGGGGDDSKWNPNIYDVAFVPKKETQEEMLANYTVGSKYSTLNRALKLVLDNKMIIQAALGFPFQDQTTTTASSSTRTTSTSLVSTTVVGIPQFISLFLTIISLISVYIKRKKE
ncbi:MAG: amylo-alpha-1,6-glucosidase [Candidatus Hodarchaeales archaeon]